MYCPSCGGEYRAGFDRCADCGVALVETLPAARAVPDGELVTVHEAGDPAEVAFVESLLEEAGIPFFKQGDSLQDLFALGRLGTGFNPVVGPTTFLVPAEQAEAARELLAGSWEESPSDEASDADPE